MGDAFPNWYGRYVGRVRGLAVFLGVGAALATGLATGVASAETGSAGSDTSVSREATSDAEPAANSGPSDDSESDADATDDVDNDADDEAVEETSVDDEDPDAIDEDATDDRDDVPSSAVETEATETEATDVEETGAADDASADEPEQAVPAAPSSHQRSAAIETLSTATELSPSETIVTGLFREVLRQDPTEAELLRYTTLLDWFGSGAVVSRLYNSTAFREDQVDTYYLELLRRDPSDAELALNTFLLKIGVPESRVIARLAGTREFYAESGGTAASFVNLLYRNALGQAADPDELQVFVQKLQAGRSLQWVASQFVRSDDFREVKVDETFQIVLGRDATNAEIATYVNSWFFRGGQAGIAKSLLAGDENMARVQSSTIPLPDMVAIEQLEELLKAPYTEGEDGFVNTFNRLIQWTPTGESCDPQEVCNTALYELLSLGGFTREMPNESIVITPIAGETTTLRPSQNEIGVEDSLEYPLTKADKLKDYLKGGAVLAKSVILTANDGTTIVDGHHRWAGLYVVNPYTQIYSNDLGYVPDAMEALKETQIAIGAQLGYLPTQEVSGPNMFTIDKDDFFDSVADIIASGDDPDDVMDVFEEERDLDSMEEVQEYLWQNVLRMRQFNQPVPGAPGRGVMPQPSDVTEMLHLMEGGGLIYTLPALAYLG